MKHDKVSVPADVLEGLEAVRLSGKTNMFDVPMVVKLALDLGFPKAALWVNEHRNLYAQGIFKGFEATEELGENLVREMTERTIEPEGGDEECADR